MSAHAPLRRRQLTAGTMLFVALLAASAATEPERVAKDASEAHSVLTGARAPTQTFFATSPFRLTQKTPQLDGRFGLGMPPASFVVDSGAPMTTAPRLVASEHFFLCATGRELAPATCQLAYQPTRHCDLRT